MKRRMVKASRLGAGIGAGINVKINPAGPILRRSQ